MFLARTIKMSKPNVNGRLIGPEISGGLDGIDCLGRVAKESVSGNGLETTSAVLYKAQQRELTPACLFKA